MPISRQYPYASNTPALGQHVREDYDNIINFVNNLELTKLDITGGTLANLTVTGTFTCNAVSTFNNNATFNNPAHFVDADTQFQAGLKTDSISELTPAARVRMVHGIKIDNIESDVGSEININDDLKIVGPAILKTDTISEATAASGITFNHAILGGVAATLGAVTLSSLTADAGDLEVESNLDLQANTIVDVLKLEATTVEVPNAGELRIDTGGSNYLRMYAPAAGNKVRIENDNFGTYIEFDNNMTLRAQGTNGVRFNSTTSDSRIRVDKIYDDGNAVTLIEFDGTDVVLTQPAGGYIRMSGLDTSNPGGSERVWANSNVLQIT